MIPRRKPKEKEAPSLTVSNNKISQAQKDSTLEELEKQINEERAQTKLRANSRNTVPENMDPQLITSKKIIQKKGNKPPKQSSENQKPEKNQNPSSESADLGIRNTNKPNKVTLSEGVGTNPIEDPVLEPTAFTYFDKITARSIFDDPLQDFF